MLYNCFVRLKTRIAGYRISECPFFFLLLGALIGLGGCSVKYAAPEIVDGGVRFSIKVQNAIKVAIAGSFNQWEKEKDLLSGPDGEGTWSIILPLADGRYEYLFVIDGERWIKDSTVPSVDDGLGGKNSVISVKR